MPIYEYQCGECSHKFDVIQKVDAPPLVDCEECGQPRLVKLMSAPSFRLKGQGWYETDFKKENRRNLAGDSGGGEAPATEAKSGADSSKNGEKSGAKTGEKGGGATASSESKSSATPAPKAAAGKTGGAAGKSSGKAGKAASAD